MALQVDKELSTGAIANYHKVHQMIVLEDKVTIIVNAYVSKAARDSGKHFIDSTVIEVALDNQSNICPVQYAYIKLKELPEFAGAIDI